MGVFSRLADIINSNVNAILDRAEDPKKIIRLIIQEMGDTLVEVRATAAKAIAERKEIVRRLARYAEAAGEWQRKAEVALAKDREDLSKAALMEKKKLADEAVALERERDDLDAALAQGEDDIVKLEAKLREAKAKQKAAKLQKYYPCAEFALRVFQGCMSQANGNSTKVRACRNHYSFSLGQCRRYAGL